MIRTFADYKLTRVAQKRYLESLPAREPLRSVLSKFFRANRRWLGRPPAPRIDRIDYTLHLQLVGNEDPVTISYWVDARDIDFLRVDDFHIDRGGRLSLPLDSVMMAPDQGRPTLVENGESRVEIRYELADRGRLRVGLGTLDLAYWEGKLQEPSHAIVTLDPRRGVPISEDVYMEDGSLGAHLTYDEYERLGDGSWVPLRIEVDAPNIHVAARSAHVQYVLRFVLLDKDTWMLAGASATELTQGGNLLRAYSSLRDSVVHR